MALGGVLASALEALMPPAKQNNTVTSAAMITRGFLVGSFTGRS